MPQSHSVLKKRAEGRRETRWQHTEYVGSVWSTADIHPAVPGGSLLRCLPPRTALCRSHQTFAAPAVTLPYQTPVGQKNREKKRKLKKQLRGSQLSICSQTPAPCCCGFFYLVYHFLSVCFTMYTNEVLWTPGMCVCVFSVGLLR